LAVANELVFYVIKKEQLLHFHYNDKDVIRRLMDDTLDYNN